MARALRPIASALLAVALALVAGRGRAEETQLHLDVEASPEAQACATEETLRARIAERLGRDPFTEAREGTTRLHVVFGQRAGGFKGSMTLVDPKGARIGARTFDRDGASCEPLVTDVVLVVAVLLEDLAPRPDGPSAPAPAPAAPAPSPSERPAPPPPASPSRERVRVDVGLGGGVALGLAPSAAAVGEGFAALDVGRVRLEGGARVSLPASGDGDVAVRAQSVMGRLAPCYGWQVLSPCAVLAIGSVSGEATGPGVTSARTAGQLFAGAGAGLVSRLFVADDLLFVRASLEVLVSIARAGFDVGSERVWDVPAVTAGATLGAGVRLP